MSLRRLWVLVSRLPQDARSNQIMYGAAASWTPDTAQRAGIAHQLAVANWQRGGGKNERPKKPKAPRLPAKVHIDLPDDI